MKVTPLKNSRGNEAKHQYKITDGDTIYFQSYDSIIFIVDRGNTTITVGCDEAFNKTTSTYEKIFLLDIFHKDFVQDLWKAIRNRVTKCDMWYIEYNEYLY